MSPFIYDYSASILLGDLAKTSSCLFAGCWVSLVSQILALTAVCSTTLFVTGTPKKAAPMPSSICAPIGFHFGTLMS